MESISFGEAIVIGFLGLITVYLMARLISAAVFKSKQQYEQEKQHGTKSNP